MKPHIRAFFGHRAVQVVTFIVATAAVLGGLGVYAKNNGLLTSDKTPSITWLTHSNVAAELNIQQSSTGAVTAKPGKPVLLIECPTETCDSSTLDVPAAIKQLGDKVKILAINPYTQKDLASALEQSFIIPSVQNAVLSTLAQSVAQQQAGANATITASDVQAVMQDSNFQTQARQVLNTPQAFEQVAPSLYALLQPVYPKFFLFDADFQLINAATGVDVTSSSDLTGFVTSGLTAASADSSTTAGSADSSAAPTTTGGAATSPSTTEPKPQGSSTSSAPSKSDTAASGK